MASNPGWLDAFRDNSGPPLYLNMNRTPTVIDYHIFVIIFGFCAVFVSFIIILPGIRREKISTFVVVTISLVIGCSMAISYVGTSWHVAEVSIISQYRAGSPAKVHADVGVFIGLTNVNITYKSKSKNEDINFNERFYFIGATEMKQEHETAKAKGLPYPLLTITEYLSKSDEGFCWGFQYRSAGYYAKNLLIITAAMWLTMIVLLCAVPRYGYYMLIWIGVMLLITATVYSFLLPYRPLVIPFESASLEFTYGWSFWLVVGSGFVAAISGAAFTLFSFTSQFSTILEVDYDTPYRYFVGNDAHLLGPSANGNHQHALATATNSATTESTCCGQKPVSKQKSDASVSTIESYPVGRLNYINSNYHQRHSGTSGINNNMQTISTTSTAAASPCSTVSTGANRSLISDGAQGQENEGFVDGDEKENDTSKSTSTINLSSRQMLTGDSMNNTTLCDGSTNALNGVNNKSSSENSNSSRSNIAKKRSITSFNSNDTVTTNDTSDNLSSNDLNDVRTDIVHGKRAVSLHNFGRFEEKQKRDRDKQRDLSRPSKSRSSNNKLPSTHL